MLCSSVTVCSVQECQWTQLLTANSETIVPMSLSCTCVSRASSLVGRLETERREKGYWSKDRNVRRELEALAGSSGSTGASKADGAQEAPAAGQGQVSLQRIREQGHGTLLQAIYKRGGPQRASMRLGISCGMCVLPAGLRGSAAADDRGMHSCRRPIHRACCSSVGARIPQVSCTQRSAPTLAQCAARAANGGCWRWAM